MHIYFLDDKILEKSSLLLSSRCPAAVLRDQCVSSELPLAAEFPASSWYYSDTGGPLSISLKHTCPLSICQLGYQFLSVISVMKAWEGGKKRLHRYNAL